MDKKISELLETIDLNDEDILMILQDGQNKKIKGKNALKNLAKQTDLEELAKKSELDDLITNFNHLNSEVENIKLKDNFIDVTLSENFINPSTSAYNPINFNSVITSKGNLLALENGKIKVGSGISFVEVSGKIQITSGGNAVGGKNIVLTVNGTNKERIMYYTDNARNIDKVFSSKPIQVNEGDLIDVRYYGSQNDVVSAGEIFTHLYVKVI